MAIPALVNGVLPPGTYSATCAEVWAAFDQIGSTTRPWLNQALPHAITLIWLRDPSAIIYVDGSYVTGKVNPNDVDIAIRSDIWDDTLFLKDRRENSHPLRGDRDESAVLLGVLTCPDIR